MHSQRSYKSALVTLCCIPVWLIPANPARADGQDLPKANWTIMVWMNAKNNLEPFAFHNYRQMAKVGSTDQVNVLVEFGRPVRHYTPASLPEGQWSKTLRFRVKKDEMATEDKAIQDLGKIDMGKGDAVADFVTWSKTNYPADHYALVIWDHGQGWRFFTATKVTHAAAPAYLAFRKELRRVSPQPTALALPVDEVVHGTVRYSSVDEDTGNKLYNRDLQDSLKKSNQNVDLLGFDACLMSMIETAYAMREIAQVLVGSQELEPGDGWDYEKCLTRLGANPKVNPKEFGKAIVDAYKEAWQGGGDTTMAATDLQSLDKLAQAVSDFADDVKDGFIQELPNIKDARTNCSTYAPDYGLPYIDLVRFFEQMEAKTSNQKLKDKSRGLIEGAKKAVIASYAAPSRQATYGSNGLSIYYPASKALFKADADNDGYRKDNTVFPVEFVQKIRWVDFLNSYFEAVP